MNKPLVSVIIPAYNAEQTIFKTLNSVFNQTFKDYEIIIINDGSTDNTLKILNDIKAENYGHDIKIISQSNGGVSSARNAGMRVAQGDFIALLDSDDVWLPEKLLVQLEVFRNDSDIVFVGTSINDVKFKHFLLKKFSRITRITLKNLLFKNFFQPSTVIFKKSILNDVGFFDENQRYAEEGNFFMRIAFEYKCVLLNDCLLNYGDGKRGFGTYGLSANIKEMEKGELLNLKYAYKKLGINFILYSISVVFSILKYWRRIFIVKIESWK